MQEVCSTTFSCKRVQNTADTFVHAEKKVAAGECARCFLLFQALDDSCIFDPSKGALQQAVNEAEMSEGAG